MREHEHEQHSEANQEKSFSNKYIELYSTFYYAISIKKKNFDVQFKYWHWNQGVK